MKTVLLILLALLTAMTTVSCSGGGGGGAAANNTGASVTLRWSTPVSYVDNAPVIVNSYRIYYSTESGIYILDPIIVPGNTNSYTIQNLTTNTTYYFVVTAIDAEGVESDPTDEQSKTL